MAETKARSKKKKEEVVEDVEISRPKKTILEKRTRKSFRELRRLLNRDTEILVMNNTQGTFYYYCPKTHMSIRLEGFGDTEIVTMEVLEGMKSRGKSIFQNYYLVILDVYPDIEIEEEIEVEDVLTYLGVGGLYTSINNELEKYGETYSDEFFDSLLMDMNLSDFRNIVSKMNFGLARQLATRGHVLFTEGKFDSRNKMVAIEEKTGIKDLFATV